MPILILFAAMGVAAVAAMAARRSIQSSGSGSGSGSPAILAGVPSPLLVLDGMLRAGQEPHPQVIMCAIAQAELMGRIDVVDALVRAFVLPVVRAAQIAQATQVFQVPGQVPGTDPEGSTWPRQDYLAYPDHPAHHPAYQSTHPTHSMPPAHPMPQIQPSYPHPDPDHDMPHPDRFAPEQSLAQGGPRPIARPEDVRVELVNPMIVKSTHPSAHSSVHSSINASPPAGGHAMGSNAGTITVSGMSSPIGGVPNDAWSDFVARIAREQVTFTSPHHVGQFRQRRSRLAELGIDPGSVVGSPEAQASALCADMGDAYRHAVDSGLVAEYRGMAVEIPASGTTQPIEVTLSGVMGVIQAAGIDGAAGWLEDPEDRRRFPHTTQAFLRTNGVF